MARVRIVSAVMKRSVVTEKDNDLMGEERVVLNSNPVQNK